MTIDIKSPRFEGGDICAECGGRCCRNRPCTYSPRDFGKTSAEILAGVEKAIAAGRASLRWSLEYDTDIVVVTAPGYNDPLGYYDPKEQLIVSPQVLREYHEISHDPCMLWGPNGCKLTLDERPLGGAIFACELLRQSKPDLPEFDPGEKDDWRRYQTELRELATRLARERQSS